MTLYCASNASSSNGDKLILADRGAAFRGGDLRFAVIDRHESIAIRIHLNSVAASANRMDRNVGRVDLDTCLRTLQYRIIAQSLTNPEPECDFYRALR